MKAIVFAIAATLATQSAADGCAAFAEQVQTGGKLGLAMNELTIAIAALPLRNKMSKEAKADLDAIRETIHARIAEYTAATKRTVAASGC